MLFTSTFSATIACILLGYFNKILMNWGLLFCSISIIANEYNPVFINNSSPYLRISFPFNLSIFNLGKHVFAPLSSTIAKICSFVKSVSDKSRDCINSVWMLPKYENSLGLKKVSDNYNFMRVIPISLIIFRKPFSKKLPFTSIILKVSPCTLKNV